MITAELIDKTFRSLIEQKEFYSMIATRLINAKKSLESAKLACLANGRIDGKNAELREASAREQLPRYYEAVDEAEIEERTARLNLDLAQLELERIKMLLRLEEVHSLTPVEDETERPF